MNCFQAFYTSWAVSQRVNNAWTLSILNFDFSLALFHCTLHIAIICCLLYMGGSTNEGITNDPCAVTFVKWIVTVRYMTFLADNIANHHRNMKFVKAILLYGNIPHRIATYTPILPLQKSFLHALWKIFQNAILHSYVISIDYSLTPIVQQLETARANCSSIMDCLRSEGKRLSISDTEYILGSLSNFASEAVLDEGSVSLVDFSRVCKSSHNGRCRALNYHRVGRLYTIGIARTCNIC